jgi:hypothetical protein
VLAEPGTQPAHGVRCSAQQGCLQGCNRACDRHGDVWQRLFCSSKHVCLWPDGIVAQGVLLLVVLLVCRAAVAVREEVREVLPGSVPQGGGPAGGKLLTVEQLAALEKASAAAGRGDGKAHKAKVCSRSAGIQLS